MGIDSNLIRWIENFLVDRSQYVKVNEATSSTRINNTGAPQGCVISPILFTLHTNDCVSSIPNCLIFKYADDAAIVGSVNNNVSEQMYFDCIKHFTSWCLDHHLQLNVNKTKELMIDFRSKPT